MSVSVRERGAWLERIERLWEERPVIWLPGVRGAGKTGLCAALPQVEHFDCELPRHRKLAEDPQTFFAGLRGKRVVLDEIHRLPNPSGFLSVAAQQFADVQLIATGTSTLAATGKLQQSLAARRAAQWLTPAMSAELGAFEVQDMTHRLHRGGLPACLLADRWPEREYQDWLEDYWAKDVQELFRLEKRRPFLRFVELLLAQSGTMFEAARFTQDCGVSRPTIAKYLTVLDASFVAHVIRPYTSRGSAEIVAAPKVYGFDTGFVCCFRGWTQLRREDLGGLWEHYVLNEMHARLQTRRFNYWRNKQGHEVDFIYARGESPPTAIECPWRAEDFDPASLKSFRRRYPEGANYVVAKDVGESYAKSYGKLEVQFIALESLIEALAAGG